MRLRLSSLKGITPAQRVGVADHRWTLEELLGWLEYVEKRLTPAQEKRDVEANQAVHPVALEGRANQSLSDGGSN